MDLKDTAFSYFYGMEILLAAATDLELDPIRQHMEGQGHVYTYLTTGVGMVATTHALTKELGQASFDLAINVGIAGSFDKDLEPGRVVTVSEDRFADLGAESPDGFLDVFEMDLADPNGRPFDHGSLGMTINFETGIPEVRGITVNKVHGLQDSIDHITAKYAPQVESMEGAAFYYCCALANVPAVQVRAISNRVEPRNKDNWEVEKALENLSTAVPELIQKIPVSA
jgi:futalosine hydrolase